MPGMSTMTDIRCEYLRSLAQLIDKARELADAPPRNDGWGGGLRLTDKGFGYGNTSDLLSELADTVREAAVEEARQARESTNDPPKKLDPKSH